VTESTAPPPPGGGGMRYAILGLLLLLGAGGIYFLTKEEEDPDGPVAQVEPDAGPPRVTMQFVPEFEIPEEEPDAGPIDAGPEETVSMTTVMRRAPRECNGNISAQELRAIVSRHNPQVRACYERRLKVNNLLQGVVNVRMIIDRQGNVDQVAVGGSLRDSEVFSCVRRLASGWSFPAPEGGACAQVSVPFRLTPRP